jgi:hypothetical protein
MLLFMKILIPKKLLKHSSGTIRVTPRQEDRKNCINRGNSRENAWRNRKYLYTRNT